MSETEILLEFKKNLIRFFDELIDQFSTEADLVIMRIFLKDQIPIEEVMKTFVYQINSNGLRKMVKDRNESFFLENDIFNLDRSNREKVSHFKRLWRSGILDEENKQVVWRWIDTFVYLSDKYVKAINQTGQ